jgi:sugar (pentulose or hexulose) kinase
LPAEYLMAIDCGSGGVKCFLVDTSGRIVSNAGVEWDRDDWNTDIGWRAIKKAIRKTLVESRIDPIQISSISTTSMREEFVLLDKPGKEILLRFTSDIYDHGDELNKRLGEKMYRYSGHWPVSGWIAASKLAWLNDKHPEVLDRANLFLMISDWAGYMLGGVPYTEGSSACETSLFDVQKSDWAWELLNELNIPSDIFPEVKKNATQVAQITGKAARGTTLNEGTPVVVGGADTQCGLIGCGAVNSGDVVVVGGTTTPVQMVTEKPVFDKEGRTWTNMHVVDGKWILESNAGRTGWVYRWFRDNILCEKPSSRIYEIMNALAARSPPGSNGVKVYMGPHVFNAGPPYWKDDTLGDASVPPAILGSSRFTRGDLARAILEANCYAVRANLEQLTEITGRKVKKVGFCGGNSKAEIWSSIQSAILGIPVSVPKERDATAVGASICAAVGAEIYRDIPKAVNAMVHMEELIEADKALTKEYDKLFNSWIEIRRRLSRVL